MVEKTKRHIENYKKQDIFADANFKPVRALKLVVIRPPERSVLDATQAREGIETTGTVAAALGLRRCNSSP